MDKEKKKRNRQMVNRITLTRVQNLQFLGIFLNATGRKREDLLRYLDISSQAFCRWFAVDDIKWSTVVQIFKWCGCSVRMSFSYENGKEPSRHSVCSIIDMIDINARLAPLFVEMKLNQYNYDTIGKTIGKTAQAVNHWFLVDDIAVSMIYRMSEAMGATVEFISERIDTAIAEQHLHRSSLNTGIIHSCHNV